MELSRPVTIGEGFQPSDKERICATALRLHTYIDGDYCYGGSIALQAQLAARSNTPIPPRLFNDMDIIMRRLGDLRPSVTRDFLIGHVHPLDPTDGFYTQLVDKTNGVEVDLFGWDRFPPEPEPAALGDRTVFVRSSADLLRVFTSAMYKRVLKGTPLIRKQLHDAELLAATTDEQAVERLWQQLHPHIPITAADALRAIHRYAAERPDHVADKPTHASPPKTCHECIDSERYPLTPLEEINSIIQRRRH